MASVIDFAKTIGLDNPEQYSAFGPMGMITGYIVSILVLQWIPQKKAMIIFLLIALASSILLVTLPAKMAIYFLSGLGFAHSIMWGSIWAITIDKLGKFTKSGASMLVVAIVGGAILPLVFGFVLDALIPAGQTATAGDFQSAYRLFIPCYLFILYYAVAGHKAGFKKILLITKKNKEYE
jgi:fucose permease